MQQLVAAKAPDTVQAARPSAILKLVRQVEIGLERVARRRGLACLVVILVALGMRAALLPVLPIPLPAVHDEFSYILGGETFAMGRLANPPHPLWRFFETIHVNMHPTYVSKYPPAQAAFLALGIRMFGHPWYGVWLSMGLLCGALCWMVQGWLPPKYGIIGGILAAMQVGVTGHWINSYWGGAVAGIGGALAIGAFPRLAQKPSAGAAIALSAGMFVLANSRPFEGLVLICLLGIALLWWARRSGNLAKLIRPAVIVPIITAIVGMTTFMAYYNSRITGNPLLMPYVVNTQQYHWQPPLWILPSASPPAIFRDSAMQGIWSWEHELHVRSRQNPLQVLRSENDSLSDLDRGAGLALIPFLISGLLLISSRRARLAAVLVTTFMCLLLLEQVILSHYIAPGFGLMVLVVMFGLQFFRTMKVRGRAVGLPVVASILLFGVCLFLAHTVGSINDIRTAPMGPAMFRAQVLKQLSAKPGRHLVMVRYGPEHTFSSFGRRLPGGFEHVYNGPDIDAQKVVWALDRGAAEDRALFAYYPDRTVWLYQPDGSRPSITPWQ